MKKLRFFLIGTLLALAGNVLADELRVPAASVKPGESSEVAVELLNPDHTYIMTEFYMSLPEGVSIAVDDDGELLCEPNSARFDRTHQLVVELGGDGKYHFLIYSSKNKALKGTEGALLTMTLLARADATPGQYEGRIVGQVFSDENKNEHNPADVTFTVTIGGSTLAAPTLTLKQGWNWVSSPTARPLPLDELKGVCSRIVGQTDELISDPQIGWAGNITALEPGRCYKVLATKDATLTCSGEAGDGPVAVEVKKGWNWVGFPLAEETSPGAAISGAEEGDRIVGSDGEATYSGGQWTGTLTTLTPGKGYLYLSASAKSLE